VLAAIVLSAGLRESKGNNKVSIDWAGAFLLVSSIVSLLLTPVLHENEGYAWDSPIIISLLAIGAALLCLFVFVEAKAKEPILPLHLFRNRTFVILSLIVFTLVLGVMGPFSTFQFFSQNVLGLTPIESGYLNLPLMVGAVLASVLSGHLMTKVPYRYIYSVALLLPALGFYLMTGIDIHTKVIAIIGYFIVLGLGFGVLFNNNLIVQESVSKEHSGIALSSITLFQSIGMTIGVSIYGSMLASQITSGLGDIMGKMSAVNPAALGQVAKGGIPKGLDAGLVEQIKVVFAHAFQHLYWVSVAVSLLVVVLCWFLKHEVLSAPSSNEKEGIAVEA
jgi:MFS family permease